MGACTLCDIDEMVPIKLVCRLWQCACKKLPVCATGAVSAGKRSFSAVLWIQDLEKDSVGRGVRVSCTRGLELIRSHLGKFLKKGVSSSDKAPA